MRCLIGAFALALLPNALAAAPPVRVAVAGCARPAWQPNGKLLACRLEVPVGSLTRLGLLVVDDHGTEKAFVPGVEGPPVWRPDGKLIAAAAGRGSRRIVLVGPDGAAPLYRSASSDLVDDSLVFGPDGVDLYVTERDPREHKDTVAVLRADGSYGNTYTGECGTPDVARDGRIACHDPAHVLVFDHGEKKTYGSFVGNETFDGVLTGPYFSHDGRFIALLGFDAMTKQPPFPAPKLWILDGKQAKPTFRALGVVDGFGVAFSPDDSELVVSTPIAGDERTMGLFVVRVSDGKRRELVAPVKGCAQSQAAWSPAGLAYVESCGDKTTLVILPRR